MDMFHGQTDLSEPVQYLILFKKLFGVFTGSDGFRQISTLGIFHDDFKFVLFGCIYLDKFDNERVSEVSENLCLLDSLLSLLLTHVINADLFDDEILTGLFLLDQISFTEGSLTKQFLFLIILILSFYDSYLHLFKKYY